MLRIRKVKTKSGAVAIQVVLYRGHLSEIISHVGSGATPAAINALVRRAQDFISEFSQQAQLFEPETANFLDVSSAEVLGVSHDFCYRFLNECIKECGLNLLSGLMLDMAIIRLIEPASKLRSLYLLNKYFGVRYSERIYRKIPKLLREKVIVEQVAFKCATEVLKEDCYFILYDVTTLYFETHKTDDLRIPGFSKDDKSKQPQIVVGLLATRSGFPLAHQVFPGNTFEGKTMLPLLEAFLSKYNRSKPIVIADAAMLSEQNIEELKKRNISYIVAARLANANRGLIQQISSTLERQNGAICRVSSMHGDLICSFAQARYRKQYRELKDQLKKAEEILSGKRSEKRTKYLTARSKKLSLNTDLVHKNELLLGIKGFCTNIPESEMPNQEIIDRYGDLWRIEQCFRMTKSDLQTRPIFHRQEQAIEAHVLICFVALIIEKYLELTTGMSLRSIKDLLFGVTETQVQDRTNQQIHIFRSPTHEIMKTRLGDLINRWGLPH